MTGTHHLELGRLHGPRELQGLDDAALARLAAAIRDELVTSVTRQGGHLGPNLGVVELTLALHLSFCSPRDAIVWDTGHQAYVHKMLTGRLEDFATLRQAGGLSGYPSRAESPHDVVENSHASTALSHADGLAKGFELTGQHDRHVVAVVGDGALTGGMCWEALNNLGAGGRRVVVVLNDNGRSYAPTVGSLAAHLAKLRSGEGSGNVFCDLGLSYVGPVDGHDLTAMREALRTAKSQDGPVLVHCVTTKGRGYAPAETDEADRLHAVSPARPATAGTRPMGAPVRRGWTEAFAESLLALARHRRDVVAVSAAMVRPTGLYPMACEFPDRVFDVGIAEQHAVTSAAGLATAGLRPVVAVYSTFLNRAFDQVLMDVALHRLPVTLVLDRAGITGPDGASHHGMWDVSLLGLVPGMRIGVPRDARRLEDLLSEATSRADGPSALRFPRGRCDEEVPARGRIGSAEVLTEPQESTDVLLVPIGSLVGTALRAADLLRRAGVTATVVDPRWVAPVDPELVLTAAEYQLVVTVEDNALSGGFGDSLARALRFAGLRARLLTLGLPPQFVCAGERTELLSRHGLDAEGITSSVCSTLGVDVRH
jgi:1-deoxy-D-xylulose-5-phosphate synthase